MAKGSTRLRIENIQFFDTHPIMDGKGQDAYPDCDGAVWLEALEPCRHEPRCEIHCESHPSDHHFHFMQPFAHDGPKFRIGSTPQEQAENRANIWRWDKNRTAPSITPSFLVPGYKEGEIITIGGKPTVMNYRPRLHTFVTAGKLVDCGDSEADIIP